MVAELISVGTELLLGNIVNTNAAYLAEKCALLGLSIYNQTVVGDNEKRLEEAICTALDRADIVILTGGLGPTKDDITKETAAAVFQRKLVMDNETIERMKSYFKDVHSGCITSNNWKQALIPEGGKIINNHNGTAPGIIMEEQEKRIILLPGPPNELKLMFETDIAPYLRQLEPEGIYSQMVKICSVGESRAETMILDLMEAQDNPTIAPYAKTGEVHLRVTAKAASKADADRLMEPVVKELYKRFGTDIYTTDENLTLEEVVVSMLKERAMKVTTAESCSGGLLAGRILNVAGASDVYDLGYITYSNEAKEKQLGVSHQTLVQYGAVSEQTAAEMAMGAAKAAQAGAALSVTGIAGPGGGSEEKPVGLVYIGCCVNGNVTVREWHFTGTREKNRDYAVVRALTMLREQLL